MQKLVVAVSGGVDSAVLLDKLVASGEYDLIVAHVDHGIRPDSGEDARLVEKLATSHNLPFELTRLSLGAAASELQAREARYGFLRQVAKANQATVATAHHKDDLYESIAINLIRGTGWRGLAVLDSPDLIRPLLDMSKADIIDYAKTHQLQWREDSTNTDTKFLRNKLRPLMSRLDSMDRQGLEYLHEKQLAIKKQIEAEVQQILSSDIEVSSRYFMTMVDESVADELLRKICLDQAPSGTTRIQRQALRIAIKTLPAGKKHRITGDLWCLVTKDRFTIQSL
ncbi:MAG: tRNA lysidine(34) synthetase TilS [bacterium]|nr:tRNA lysidine(34) synthetase TilS [bacterium]MDN5835479.1 tRNA lysidine(34) synthetase TilS [bacterium]